MVKPGPMPPGEHNKVESKKLHKLGRFPKQRAAGRAASAAEKPSHREALENLRKPPPLVEPAVYHCGFPTVAGERWGTQPHNPAAGWLRLGCFPGYVFA